MEWKFSYSLPQFFIAQVLVPGIREYGDNRAPGLLGCHLQRSDQRGARRNPDEQALVARQGPRHLVRRLDKRCAAAGINLPIGVLAVLLIQAFVEDEDVVAWAGGAWLG